MPEPRARTPAQRAGDAAESVVAGRLEALGWRILGRNVRVGHAEIDVLAIDTGPPATIVVVEVRYRARRDFGLAEETITYRKRQVLRAALATLRERQALPPLPARIDLVVVEPGSPPRVRHHRHAF